MPEDVLQSVKFSTKEYLRISGPLRLKKSSSGEVVILTGLFYKIIKPWRLSALAG
jgi:hypothetical protein